MLGVKIPVETEIYDYAENRGWIGVSTRGVPHRTRWSFEAFVNLEYLPVSII